jgi:hypothetical protein
MIALLDTSEDLNVCAAELGCETAQLLTPLTRRKPQQPDKSFAIDNGAFSYFDAKAFKSLLARNYERRHLCKFVAVPDVVASARRTLEVFDYWHDEPCLRHWPLALVLQDGQEDLPICWNLIEAVFVGGSTKWKLSSHAAACVKAAKAMGKYVHAGRVNEPARFEYFEKLGADSIDGTGLAQYTHMREKIWKAYHAPQLLPREDAAA